MDLWEPFNLFRLREFPLAAALRLEPEDDYAWRLVDECKVARMVERSTPAEARVLGMTDHYDPSSADVFDFFLPLAKLSEVRFDR